LTCFWIDNSSWWHFLFILYFQMRSYVHLFDDVKQDYQAVAAIVKNVLEQVKTDLGDLKTAFLRSDNAGCYKCANLLTCLPSITKATGDYLQVIYAGTYKYIPCPICTIGYMCTAIVSICFPWTCFLFMQ
jgi:hypothetical protein